MKVLVTGAQGQLARALAELEAPRLEMQFVGRPQLDLAVPGSATRLIEDVRPDVVVNAGAYTAVDQAEQESALAFAINSTGAGEVAAAAAAIGAPVIQISTDYVFDGLSERPYREDDPTRPINAYGASKLAGEEAVRAANPDHVILRSSWVFSPFGRNFVRTMLRLAETRDQIGVVADQIGSPTSATSLAAAIGGLLLRGPSDGLGETYHVTGTGACSWADFAEEIFAASAAAGGSGAVVKRITTADFPTPAARPRYSVLDNAKVARDVGIAMPAWQDEVRAVVERLVAAA